LVCNNNNHSIYCPSYKYTSLSLKGASEVNNQPKQLTFHKREVDRISKVLELGKYYVSNQNQNPDILNEINNAMSILDARKNNKKIYMLKRNSNIKGASSICYKTKIQSFDNIKKLFSLSH
jgi:hypothetical protein